MPVSCRKPGRTVPEGEKSGSGLSCIVIYLLICFAGTRPGGSSDVHRRGADCTLSRSMAIALDDAEPER